MRGEEKYIMVKEGKILRGRKVIGYVSFLPLLLIERFSCLKLFYRPVENRSIT